jgi:hypothetical protein
MEQTKYKGQLAGFPHEIVDKMLEKQVNCGNKRDVSKFEAYVECGGNDGFTWSKTIEGHDFWSDVISRKYFIKFFEKYPKKEILRSKIVGYKSPHNLYNGRILKGSLFRQSTVDTENYTNDGSGILNAIPKEIVETWEPIYEYEEIKAGDWVVTTTEISKSYEKPYKDEVFQIIKVDARYVYFGEHRAVEISRVRLATPEEINAAIQTVIRMGGENGFDLTVKNGRVYHKTEDITNFVKEVQLHFNQTCKIAGYDFVIKDILLSKTGCESKETKLSEWLAIKL